MDTEIAQTPKMWESCVNPKTTYSIIVDGCWKRPKFQSAAFQGLGFLIFDQCSTMNYRSEGSNPSSSVGVGFKYYTSSFTIKDFLGYGYNDSSVIVKCTDSLNGIKYLISYETKYRSKKGNPLISFKDLSESDFEQVKSKYEWLEVGKEKYHAIESNKFLFMIGALLSLILFVWRLFNLEASKPR